MWNRRVKADLILIFSTNIEVWLPSFAFCLSRFYVWVGGEGEGASQIVWFLQNPKDLQSQVFHTNQGTRA